LARLVPGYLSAWALAAAFSSFALFALSTVHVLTAGTDAGSSSFRLAVVAACGLVTGLTALRIARSILRSAVQPVH